MTTQLTYSEWQRRAAQLLQQLPHQAMAGRAFINGQYVKAINEQTLAKYNPVNGQLLIHLAACDDLDADRAVLSARQSFERGSWSAASPAHRKKVLQRLAELILAHQQELALLETFDVGKPIAESLKIDIQGSARCFAWYGELIDKRNDEVLPTEYKVLGIARREALGVVAAIVPWNFPLLMTAWKIAPALAMGNSVVLKPSEKSSLTALRLAQLAVEAGIPDGVLNVVTGAGAAIGKALALHNDVDCVAFTGSTAVGKLILQYAGQSNMKRVWLECGGKSPNIVFADCEDLDKAATAAAFAIFFNQGEMCSAGSRLLVEASIKTQFLEKILQRATQFFPADPLNPSTRMGAIVDEQQLHRVLNYIEIGQQQGAQLIQGGQQVLRESGGYFVEPTIFDHVTPIMRIAQEEIFGPVLAVQTFATEAEAIELANNTIYGLAAAVWTNQLNKAHRMARAIRAGTVWINCYDEGDMSAPFGGFKQSGNGRDKSIHALDKYSDLKAIWMEF